MSILFGILIYAFLAGMIDVILNAFGVSQGLSIILGLFWPLYGPFVIVIVYYVILLPIKLISDAWKKD